MQEIEKDKFVGILLSIVVPTYNEIENIQELISKIEHICSHNNIKYEIIVSDDNSPDLTYKLVAEISKKNDNIIIIRRLRNRGLTPSVIEGMEKSRGEYIAVMDADLQHDIAILPIMLNYIKNYDVVIGSRYLDKDSLNHLSTSRKILSKSGTILAKLILNLSLTDPLSGYFIIKKTVFEKISPEISSRGFKVLLQILGREKNLQVKEVPYNFYERKRGSTKLNGEVAIDFLAEILTLRLKKRVSSRFLRYALTGLSGVFVNLFGQLIGNYSMGITDISYKNNDYVLPGLSVVLGFILSVVNNFYWNNKWTFRDKKIEGFIPRGIGLGKYFFITCIGLLIQISVWRFLTEIFQSVIPDYKIYPYLANFSGILCATTWNYYLSKNFMWKIE